MRKTLLLLSAASLLSILALAAPASSAAAVGHVPGDVLVVFKPEEGVKVTAASVTEGDEALRVASVAASLGARVAASCTCSPTSIRASPRAMGCT